MDLDKKFGICLACFILIAATIAFCSFQISVGMVSVTNNCFAVDSSGKVYVESDDDIYVYQDNKLQYVFSEFDGFQGISRKGTFFTITEDDIFALATGGYIYYMDLQGNVLESYTYEELPAVYYDLIPGDKAFVAANGDRYKMEHALGRTSIVKNGKEVVYQISLFSYFVKLAFFLSFAALIPTAFVLIKLGIEKYRG